MAVFSFANGWPGREPVIRPVLMSGTLHNGDFECVSAMLAGRRRHSETKTANAHRIGSNGSVNGASAGMRLLSIRLRLVPYYCSDIQFWRRRIGAHWTTSSSRL